MTSQVHIPIELLELIVENADNQSSEGRQSLVNCSYANQALFAICQKRIFRDVRLRQNVDRVCGTFSEARGTDGDRFLELITSRESCHLATYVRNLSINVGIVTDVLYPSQDSRPDLTTHISAKPDFPLYVIVPLLPNLKKFSVVPPLTGPSSVNWGTLDPRTKKFFADIVQRLPEIDLRSISDMLIETFSNCPSLEVLHISAVHTRATQPICRPKLKFLDFGHNPREHISPDDILEHFHSIYSPFDITHLTGLKLPNVYLLASDVDNILALCANTLESLDLAVGHSAKCMVSYSSQSFVSRPEATTPNLSSLYNLRSLILRASIFCYAVSGLEDLCTSEIPYIPAILQTLPTIMRSPTFELVLDIIFFPSMECLATFPWSCIVDVLEQDRFTHKSTTVKFAFHQEKGRHEAEKVLDAKPLLEILDRNDDMRRLGKKDIRLMSASAGVDR